MPPKISLPGLSEITALGLGNDTILGCSADGSIASLNMRTGRYKTGSVKDAVNDSVLIRAKVMNGFVLVSNRTGEHLVMDCETLEIKDRFTGSPHTFATPAVLLDKSLDNVVISYVKYLKTIAFRRYNIVSHGRRGGVQGAGCDSSKDLSADSSQQPGRAAQLGGRGPQRRSFLNRFPDAGPRELEVSDISFIGEQEVIRDDDANILGLDGTYDDEPAVVVLSEKELLLCYIVKGEWVLKQTRTWPIPTTTVIPSYLVVDGGSLWVLFSDGYLDCFDSKTLKRTRRIKSMERCSALGSQITNLPNQICVVGNRILYGLNSIGIVIIDKEAETVCSLIRISSSRTVAWSCSKDRIGYSNGGNVITIVQMPAG